MQDHLVSAVHEVLVKDLLEHVPVPSHKSTAAAAAAVVVVVSMTITEIVTGPKTATEAQAQGQTEVVGAMRPRGHMYTYSRCIQTHHERMWRVKVRTRRSP